MSSPFFGTFSNNGQRTRELIEASGAEILFLPPYSPDYNPIEHDFANIKRLREYNADIPLNDVTTCVSWFYLCNIMFHTFSVFLFS